MRIYFIGQKGIPTIAGGIEKHVESIAVIMAQKGHEVFVYTRPYYTDKNLKTYKGVNLISLPTLRFKNLDAIFHTFLASVHVLFRKADIIHYQGIGPSIMLLIPKIFKRKAKILATVHSDDRLHEKWSWFAKIMLGFGARIASRCSDAAIAIAKYQKSDFDKEFNAKLYYIPNGVNLYPKFKPNLIKKQFGISQDYILFVSRFVKHKGLHYLIESYNKIKNPKKKLVIIGSSVYTDSYSQKVHEMAQGNDNIIFVGTVSGQTYFEFISNAFLYVIPSEYEGLSIALLEVMSFGTPVLASNITPNLESLNGLGFTFKNKNVKDLNDKLVYLMNHEREVYESAKLLRKRVENEYNWEKVVDQTLNLYTKLLS